VSEPVSSKDKPLSKTADTVKAVRQHPKQARPSLAADDAYEQDYDEELLPRRRRWPIPIAILLAAIILGGAVTYLVLSSQAQTREANRTAGYVLLDEAIALIQESDTVVIVLDAATTTEVSQSNLSERKVLLERVPSTLETLSSAEEGARAALSMFTSDDDKELAQHVINAAVNRRDMLTSGETIITKDIAAMNSALFFGQAWALIVSADTELRATTELSRTGGYYALQEAIARNNEILLSLDRALEIVTQAHEAFPEADYDAVFDYLDLKSQSILLAIAADQAILDGDIDLLNARNAEFELKDAAVVNAAGKIPPEPLTLIIVAYDAATEDARALYNSARANAAEADRFIREYVGVETQTAVQ